MGDFRRTLHLLCCLALVFTGGLGRGLVWCIDGGSIRLEASGLDGSCYQRSGKAPAHAALRTGCEPDRCGNSVVRSAPCGGCEDVTVIEATASVPAGSVASLLPAQPVSLAFASLWPPSFPEPPGRGPGLHSTLVASRSFDVYAVRKTIVLLI